MADPAAAPPSFDFGKKKKKKPRAKTAAAPAAAAAAAETPAAEDKAAAAEPTAEEPATAEEKPAAAAAAEGGEAAAEGEAADSAGASSANSDKNEVEEDYTYDELHARAYRLVAAARPKEKVVYKMKPPVLYREGSKKVVWSNFSEGCRVMNREIEHVRSFVLAELGTSGSLDGNQRLVLKGRFQPKHIEVILRHYINEYVKCHTCKSPETFLKKENRLLFMECEKCKSVRSVASIQTGFKVTTRAARRAART